MRCDRLATPHCSRQPESAFILAGIRKRHPNRGDGVHGGLLGTRIRDPRGSWNRSCVGKCKGRQCSAREKVRRQRCSVVAATHACGLVRASFRPGRDIASLRTYLRLRERLLDYSVSAVRQRHHFSSPKAFVRRYCLPCSGCSWRIHLDSTWCSGWMHQRPYLLLCISDADNRPGGLMEGLRLARAGRAASFQGMLGCMSGSSLSMAPAFIIAQL